MDWLYWDEPKKEGNGNSSVIDGQIRKQIYAEIDEEVIGVMSFTWNGV
jgi:hypothetical protein